MIEGPTTDPFVFSEDVWACVRRLERTYFDKDIKYLFVDDLIMSIKPNVHRY